MVRARHTVYCGSVAAVTVDSAIVGCTGVSSLFILHPSAPTLATFRDSATKFSDRSCVCVWPTATAVDMSDRLHVHHVCPKSINVYWNVPLCNSASAPPSLREECSIPTHQQCWYSSEWMRSFAGHCAVNKTWTTCTALAHARCLMLLQTPSWFESLIRNDLSLLRAGGGGALKMLIWKTRHWKMREEQNMTSLEKLNERNRKSSPATSVVSLVLWYN